MNQAIAIEKVEQRAFDLYHKQLENMTEDEKDSVDVVLLENKQIDKYLIGKIEAFDDNAPTVFFYIESNQGQSDNFENYNEALMAYNAIESNGNWGIHHA